MKNPESFVYKLVDVLGADENKYLMLHNRLFKGAAITREWLNWYHQKIGNLEKYSLGTRTYGIFDDEALIGIWSVEPKIFVANNGSGLKCGRCFAVGIDPDYRRLGLFVELSKYSIEQEKRLGEYDYILGFPQIGRAVVGGHLKAGWSEALKYSAFGFDIESTVPMLTRASAEIIRDFSGHNMNELVPGSFFELDEYRNKRWLGHPNHHYLCYSLGDSYMVLKPYSNFCHIVDFKGSKEKLRNLFEIAKDLSKRHGWVELNLWCAENEIFKDVILQAGFTEGATYASSITMIVVPITAKNIFEPLNQCHLTMGIEEPY